MIMIIIMIIVMIIRAAGWGGAAGTGVPRGVQTSRDDSFLAFAARLNLPRICACMLEDAP